MDIVYKPWGRYEVVYEGEDCKVKRLIVKDGSSISLQKHYKRAEHWVVISGRGRVKVGEEEREISVGEYVYIEKGEVHKLWGKEGLVIVEVQTGEAFEEEDIERYDSNS